MPLAFLNRAFLGEDSSHVKRHFSSNFASSDQGHDFQLPFSVLGCKTLNKENMWLGYLETLAQMPCQHVLRIYPLPWILELKTLAGGNRERMCHSKASPAQTESTLPERQDLPHDYPEMPGFSNAALVHCFHVTMSQSMKWTMCGFWNLETR